MCRHDPSGRRGGVCSVILRYIAEDLGLSLSYTYGTLSYTYGTLSYTYGTLSYTYGTLSYTYGTLTL